MSVDSTAADARGHRGRDRARPVDLAAEDGGVPEGAVIFVNATTCPTPLAVYSLPFNDGGLLACLYAPSGRGLPRLRRCSERGVAMRDTIKGCVYRRAGRCRR